MSVSQIDTHMIDYLTYYYTRGTPPFRSLSALPAGEAIQVMQDLYARFEGSILFERFRDPVLYLHQRQQTEQWVRDLFVARGGRPLAAYPISMVLGTSRWIEKHAPGTADTQAEIRIPLSVLEASEISFTYPDSMISFWFGQEKPAAYYQPDYHGRVFTLAEILALVKLKGLPEEEWAINLPDDLAPYIEAQVWNHKPLLEYKRQPDKNQGNR